MANDKLIRDLEATITAVVTGEDPGAPAKLRETSAALQRYAKGGLGKPATSFAQALDRIVKNRSDHGAFDALGGAGTALDAQTRKICRTA